MSNYLAENKILLILTIFAVFRLARLVAKEVGPFGIFKWLRSTFPENEVWQEGISCPYCLSFWIAIPFTYIYLLPTRLGNFILIWLGIAGIIAVWLDIKEAFGKDE